MADNITPTGPAAAPTVPAPAPAPATAPAPAVPAFPGGTMEKYYALIYLPALLRPRH